MPNPKTKPKKKSDPAKHVAVRLDDDLRERVEALIPRLSTEWLACTMSDALRACIVRGVPLVEAEFPAKPTPKKGGKA